MLSFKSVACMTNIGGLHIRPAVTIRKTLEAETGAEFSQYTEKGPVTDADTIQPVEMRKTQRKRQSHGRRNTPASKKPRKTQTIRKRTKSVITHKRKNKPTSKSKDRF